MKRKIQYGPLTAAVALPLAVGGLAAWLTKDGMKLFQLIPKPPLTPPPWVFVGAWTLLYVLMGLASYLVWCSAAGPSRRDRALTVYALGLAVNLLWPIVFFTMRLYFPAFLLLLLLWVLAAVTALLFSCIDSRAGKLMTPYLLWLSFAGYLNIGVWLLNR